MSTAKFIQPPIPSPHVSPPKSRTTLTRTLKLHVASHHWCPIRFGEKPTYGISVTKASAAQTEHLPSDDGGTAAADETAPQLKQELFASLQGIDRGIFGVESAKKNEIERLVELLESQNPNPQPTLCLDKVAGAWKLVYSTITILGKKRTKLGLRDFVSLGDFLQNIIIDEGKAVNVIKFSARGLSLLSGQLTIDASFKVASPSRVDITFNKAEITPEQLMNVFRKNYELLLGIFNPQGWLEITYVDDGLRIGRDDKGNIFILERVEEKDTS